MMAINYHFSEKMTTKEMAKYQLLAITTKSGSLP